MTKRPTSPHADFTGLTGTQVAVLSLLGSALCGTSSVPMPDDVDWQAVLDEMIAQTVFAIPSNNLPDRIPEDIQEAWRKRSLQNVARTIRLLAEQQSATRLLSANDPSVVVLKDAAAAVYYPDPTLRCMGDVDLLSLDGKFDDMCELLASNGYEYCGTGGPSHDQYARNGVLFEPHRFFAAPPGSRSALRAVDDAINASGARIRNADVCGFETPMLPDAENGLILLAHIALHLKRGVGLRHVCDWMMFASRKCDDAFWTRKLEPLARRAGLDKPAKVTTRTCQLFLGLPEEGRSWCSDADESLCRSLLDDALANGNFGRKRSAVLDYNYGMGRYDLRHPLKAAREIQRVGRQKLEARGHKRAAAPFGWLYQAPI